MHQKLILLFTIITTTAFGQTNQTVDLKWKISEKENLKYLTVMSDFSIDKETNDSINSDLESFNNGLNGSKDFFENINKALEDYNFISTLTSNNRGIVDIVMHMKPKEISKEFFIDSSTSKVEEFQNLIKLMSQNVMLRGSVYETGGIHSFWVKSSQKNLIALLFELPSKPVKVGDKWSLDIQFITNDQNFKCDTSFKINEVTLLEIKKDDSSTVAVLNYNIMEYVKGNFNTPSFFEGEIKEKETMMKFTHKGIAEFSINKGRWIYYDGLMSVETTGIISTNKKTKLTLIDENYTDK